MTELKSKRQLEAKDAEYNGWKNYQTWNVSLWICNDEGLYSIAKTVKGYSEFILELEGRGAGPIIEQTPDGVLWNDPALDIEALDAMIRDL